MIALALVLLQAAATPVQGQRFSILVDPCASANDDQGRDVIVCGRPDAISPRLPMRDLRGPPDHPVPSNPDMKGEVALNGPAANYAQECGLYGEGCPIGGGGYIVPKLVDGAVGLVKNAFARKPDKRGRVAIDLDAAAPPIAAGAIRP